MNFNLLRLCQANIGQAPHVEALTKLAPRKAKERFGLMFDKCSASFWGKILPVYLRSGETDPVQFKGLCKQISPLRYRIFRSLEKGKFVFQKSLSKTPFKPDWVSFCTPNYQGVQISGLSNVLRPLSLRALPRNHKWSQCT